MGFEHDTPQFIELTEPSGYNDAGLYHYNDRRKSETDYGISIMEAFDDLLSQNINVKWFALTMGNMSIKKEVSKWILSVSYTS